MIINDALPKVNWQSTAVKARTERLERGTKGLKRTAKQADVQVLQGLFAKAAKENWDFADWVKASRSRADVSKWRRLLTWPFGEEGGVFSFNREGDAAYIISSIGRCVCMCEREKERRGRVWFFLHFLLCWAAQ